MYLMFDDMLKFWPQSTFRRVCCVYYIGRCLRFAVLQNSHFRYVYVLGSIITTRWTLSFLLNAYRPNNSLNAPLQNEQGSGGLFATQVLLDSFVNCCCNLTISGIERRLLVPSP